MREGVRFWQAVALVAVVVATTGWTAVAVMALRPAPAGGAAASPADVLPTFEPIPSDPASEDPPVESHAVADLEALLPPTLNGTTLTRESWTGDTILGSDAWSASLTAYLTGTGKTAADLQAAQAYDVAGGLDISAGAFRVAGLDAPNLRDAMIAAWKGDFPDLKVATTSIDGFAVTTGDFGEGAVNSYWYVRDDVVFDIETSDPAIAKAALASLPKAGSTSAPSPASSPSASPGAPLGPSPSR